MNRFGPQISPAGVTFRLWAPAAKRVALRLETPVADSPAREPLALAPRGDGWHEIFVAGAGDGTRYRFRIDDEIDVPDPASPFQPADVQGPSEVVDHDRYRWQTTAWKGRPWTEAVICEAHVGAFTREGSYRAMIERLDHLVATGFTALELMPLADFPGRRNWGYDGVLWYAPDSVYGRPEDLKQLIDEAHRRGLMVFLDVVYNHFGPEGNYLGRYAPEFFCEAETPWGAAIDYTRPEVRAFAIENALHWLANYRFDGLRLDAVHAITEQGTPPMLRALSAAVGALAAASGRHIHLVLENDDNCASLLAPQIDPPAGRYRAQWNDDYHHAWHVLLTGEGHAYYRDYVDDPRRAIRRCLAAGFAYQGEASAHRGGAARGEPSGALSPLAFVDFLQNHDQIGNRALGERLESLTTPEAIAAALSITLLAPMPPLLFMGEEWGARQPFPFFCDFTGDLASAVREGRRREFAAAYEKYGEDIPDPLADSTFIMAHLDWTDPAGAPGRARLALVRELLAIRRRAIVPHLAAAEFLDAGIASGDGLLSQRWRLGTHTLALLANLSDQAIATPGAMPGAPLWGGPPPPELARWSVHWSLD